MQIARLFEMVYILLSRQNVTAKEFAERFEVSTRTIYRDVETLGAAGIPIYSAKGKGGGIRLLEGFVLDKSVFTEAERGDILSALQALNVANGANAQGVLAKLSALFCEQSPAWVEVDLADWGKESAEKFGRIKSAVLGKKVISFEYYNTKSQKIFRKAEPLQLYFKHRAWYLRAFCLIRNDFRLFKLSRMRNLLICNEEVRHSFRPTDFKYLADLSAAPTVHLKLRVSARAEYRVFDEFEEGDIKKNRDGSYLIEADFIADEWVYGYILSFGEAMEVLSPAEVREVIWEKLNKSINNYI